MGTRFLSADCLEYLLHMHLQGGENERESGLLHRAIPVRGPPLPPDKRSDASRSRLRDRVLFEAELDEIR